LLDAGIDADGEVLASVGRHSDVAKRIIDRATSRHADLIVLGPQKHRGLAGSLIGDVTAEIVRNAPTDVLIVGPESGPGRRGSTRTA
jgi:nucleotide-binding universal stress UspA family protein